MDRQTRYAKTADGVHIAYQVVGDGPVDMVFVMGWVTNIEVMWDDPENALSKSGRASRASARMRPSPDPATWINAMDAPSLWPTSTASSIPREFRHTDAEAERGVEVPEAGWDGIARQNCIPCRLLN